MEGAEPFSQPKSLRYQEGGAMVKRYVSLTMGAVILTLVVFWSLALAREPVSQGDTAVPASTLTVHEERQASINLPAGPTISRAVSVEPVRLQIAESITMQVRTSPLEPFSVVRLAGRDDAIRLIRPDFQALTGQVVNETYSISSSVSKGGSVNDVARLAATCVVTITSDSGTGTLRRCLEKAMVGDTITFDASVFPPTRPVTISLSSALPRIITNSLTIDASNAGVILDGSGLSNGTGFIVAGADRVKIRGLQIVRFPLDGVAIIGAATNTTIGGDRFTGSGPLGQGNLISGNGSRGVYFQDSGTMSNTVLGNYIGTNVAGIASFGNGTIGVFIGFGATNNTIGGDTPGARNLISGNGDAGVKIQDAGTRQNLVVGNFIGTDASGTASLANGRFGVIILAGPTHNTIGGQVSGTLNLISGNGNTGIQLQDSGTMSNTILGNYIGTSVSGRGSLANSNFGVLVGRGASNNVIGGSSPGARNVVSGNGYNGIRVVDSGTSGNRVLGNYIGTDASGNTLLANAGDGVLVAFGASGNTIGGDTPGARNVISGNGDTGVWIQDPGTSGNQVCGNYIGTNISGTTAIPNHDGVFIGWEATGNTIGGSTAGSGNLISGNSNIGVKIHGEATQNNDVVGNYIGTDVYGMAALPNYTGVVILTKAALNTIGGETLGARNLVSGNTLAGVWIQGEGTSGNRILGNYIGTDVSGSMPLGNGEYGVFIGEATNNTVGGDTSSVRNLISGNGRVGVWIQSIGTMSNTVLGNYIGTDASGAASLGNGELGVLIHAGAANNTVGGDAPGARNLISGNGQIGVQIEDIGTMSNTVAGNYVGTDASGTASLGNGAYGVLIFAGAANNIVGGDTPGTRNLVSGNGKAGIWIDGEGTSENRVVGNYIGTDVSGNAALANAKCGVFIQNGATNNIVGGHTPGARNLISGNGQAGVGIEDMGTSENQVLGNYIGTNVSGTIPLANAQFGVLVQEGATNNTIGISNTIVYNALGGVVISGTNTLYNTVTRNIIHDNRGLPIDVVALPIPVHPSPPMFICFSLDNILLGTACPGCRVEIFANPSITPAGTVFLGDALADVSGGFNLALAGLPSHLYLAATATDPSGTTGEFSEGFSWPDHRCFGVFLPLITKNG
jgi:hypothetical protein